MNWPAPQVGQVIRYAYLWKREADEGREEGIKDRPAVIVVAQHREGSRTRVVVAPITHTPPADAGAGVELPPATRRRIGLDDVRQWIVLNELNSFLWPGPDLRPLPGQGLLSVIVGVLPAGLSRLVNERLQAGIRSRLVAIIARSDAK